MFDNGLLKFYKNRAYRSGFFNVNDAYIKETGNPSFYDNTAKCTSPVGVFYKKFRNYFSQEGADAEILLSQIYYGMGVKSAIYIPATDGRNRFLLSNDVENENTIKAKDFNKRILTETDCSERDIKSLMCDPNAGSEIVKYFSQKALAQKIKMRILDLATLNPDRQECNYFYVLDDNGQAVDIVTIDHERSGIVASNSSGFARNLTMSGGYQNDFAIRNASQTEVLDTIKNSEFVNNVMDVRAFGEEIGNVDVREISHDIVSTTGYCVDGRYIDTISNSLMKTANILTK